jgi:regulator of replication initiation timing
MTAVAILSLLGTTIDVPAWVAIVGAVFGAVSLIATSVAVGRQRAIRTSLDTLIEANEGLRKANDDLRAELKIEQEKRAQLEGRLDAVTSHLAEQIINAVAAAVARKGNV